MTSNRYQKAQSWVLDMLENAETAAALDGYSTEDAFEIGAEAKRLAEILRIAIAQPAAGEPVDGVEGFACWLIDHCEGYEIFEEKIQDWVADYLKSDAYQRISAPPAAAHGDEAVRKDAEYFRFIESCPIRTGVVLSRKAHEAGFDLRDECERVMAMRAQGDGGSGDA